MGPPLRRLPLHDRHVALGARLAPFAGYEMPVRYGSIVAEHQAVRQRVGLFDVSHMGEVELTGTEAGAVADHLVTNDVAALADGQALYTVMCHEDGGIVDDLLVYRLAAEHYLLCVNAANRAKDAAHIERVAAGRCQVSDRSDDWVQLALQGPAAEALLGPLTDLDLRSLDSFQAGWGTIADTRVLISRTGYTGEDGFELYYPTPMAEAVFDVLVEAGPAHDLALVGLGARDTLRLEARLMLYGNDLTDDTTPLEAGLGWTVKLDKGPFVGRDALIAQKASGVTRRLRGLIANERGILRPGYPIVAEGRAIGTTTSGGPSPTLGGSIGLGYIEVDDANRDEVDVLVRDKPLRCAVTRKPFYKRPGD